jgi:N-acylneuraminate cytidylyltransferase
MNTLCIIPARGGSKRLPGKNLVSFRGLPLFFWTVQVALEFGPVFIATDSIPIMELTNQHFPTVLVHLLSDNEAGDNAGMLTAVYSVWDTLQEKPDRVCILPPTAPLRTVEDVKAAIQKSEETGALVSMAVSKYNLPPWQALYTEGGLTSPYFGDRVYRKSQQMPKLFCDAGSVYVVSKRFLDERRTTLYTPDLAVVEIPIERAADIDDVDTLRLAGILMEAQEK